MISMKYNLHQKDDQLNHHAFQTQYLTIILPWHVKRNNFLLVT